MRILIADESVAGSEHLREYFPGAAGSGAPLTVACATKPRCENTDECACAPFDLNDQLEFQATILDMLGMALLNRGCLREGGPLIEQARQIRRDFLGTEHPAYAMSQNSYARLQRELGDYKEAERAACDALRINTAVSAKSLAVANSLFQLSVVQIDQGHFDAAHHSATQGLDMMSALGSYGVRDPNYTRLLEIRGRAELYLGQPDKAAATYLELLDLDAEELGTRKHYKYATHMGNFGMVREVQGRKEDAERAYREAIGYFADCFDTPCHPNLIDFHANLGSLLRERGTPEAVKEAATLFARALELDRKARGDGHVLVGNDHANLGRSRYDCGDVPAALDSLDQALAVYEQKVKEGELPPEHFFLAEARTWKGRILVERNTPGDACAAQPLLELAIIHWPAQLGPGTVGEGMARACLGRALFLQDKEGERACELLCQGYAIIKEKSPDAAFVARVKGWIDQQGCHCESC